LDKVKQKIEPYFIYFATLPYKNRYFGNVRLGLTDTGGKKSEILEYSF